MYKPSWMCVQNLVGLEKPKKKWNRIKGHFVCPNCSRSYIRKDSLQRHLTYECGKEPQFQCPFCPQKCKRKAHQIRHIRRQHKDKIGIMEENNPELKLDNIEWAPMLFMDRILSRLSYVIKRYIFLEDVFTLYVVSWALSHLESVKTEIHWSLIHISILGLPYRLPFPMSLIKVFG